MPVNMYTVTVTVTDNLLRQKSSAFPPQYLDYYANMFRAPLHEVYTDMHVHVELIAYRFTSAYIPMNMNTDMQVHVMYMLKYYYIYITQS